MKQIFSFLLCLLLVNTIEAQKKQPKKTKTKKTTTVVQKKASAKTEAIQDTVKAEALSKVTKTWLPDTLLAPKEAYKIVKNEAHASYYADKFTGRKTASGKIFNNNGYTAAHRKYPFGTKLKVTNDKTGKSVIVTVTDRGPFVKGRDIDLTKRAFMEIAPKSYGGSIKVSIAELAKP
ncbi:septal ring lytic transglycosylase RlpA family protein [Flavobacterium branchiophilum]|uniref:Probable endolytic peptidoglycan transglycosylase RlpA n=2 Tax=Flavobacterium branchiophilum TaxID=55197 RepID=G2Z400_FLABF|nr:septal ring lytic transglycosylase RlpA family protein [Flavobacterium branchiophilum]PDS26715.1 septal ring lytic transglycosylase RlpA family protein [Flavobacterium branchiophilum]CCB68332.1 Protein of unknown function precursor [Flavobacterium branchiophilum FL-15]